LTNSKTFRLFISSTFNDFRREREILQTIVFPHAKEYCSQRGYTFQPIDLRWGVSNEAQLDQKTLELCLSEVRACKSHIHPNFLIMIGDRYGWIPLPYAIEEKEFETLLALIDSNEEKQLLKEWYKLDLNQLPASYILKERSGDYEEFEKWLVVETNIRTILQSAVNNSNLSEEQKRKYFLSATEAEVQEGIIPYIKPTKYQTELLKENSSLNDIDPQHIFGFFRNIDKSSQIEDKFIQHDYDEAQEFKTRVDDVLVDSNILHAREIKQIDKDTLNEDYLKEFEERMIQFLESQINSQKAEETDSKLSPLEIELQAQTYFALNKRKDFLAQEELRTIIANYMTDDNQEPLVIYGESGRGKSALMSKAIQEVQDTLQKKVLYRFVSATPNSSSSKEILTSIFDELDVDVRSKNEKESFEDFSQRIYSEILNIKENIVIFIDAVDQLGNNEYFLWLPKTLPSNVKIVISALEDDKYKEDSKYLEALRTKTDNLHLIPEFNEPSKLLKALLQREDRILQEDQETYFLERFKSSPSPLYVSIAAQEIKNWKSYDYIQGNTPKEHGVEQDLKQTQQGIIKEFIDNLTSIYHHNKSFVEQVIGFLFASRDGLSESELLQLISTDKIFVQKMAPETWHDNPTQELPMIHWSRLHTQLKPFLSLKTQDGEELMYFFHREFEDVISTLANQYKEHEAIIIATQKMIIKHQQENFHNNRWGKIYKDLLREYRVQSFYYKKYKKRRYKSFFKFFKTVDHQWIDNFYEYMQEFFDYYKHNNYDINESTVRVAALSEFFLLFPNRRFNILIHYSKIEACKKYTNLTYMFRSTPFFLQLCLALNFVCVKEFIKKLIIIRSIPLIAFSYRLAAILLVLVLAVPLMIFSLGKKIFKKNKNTKELE
jgi:hypothetical protein